MGSLMEQSLVHSIVTLAYGTTGLDPSVVNVAPLSNCPDKSCKSKGQL